MFEDVVVRIRVAYRILLCLVIFTVVAPKPAFTQAGSPSAIKSARPAIPPTTPPLLPPAVKSAEAQFDKAVQLQKAGKIDAALAAYRDYLRLLRSSHLTQAAALPAYQNMLPLYRARNDKLGIDATLREICAANPNESAAWAELATIAADRHDYKATRTYAGHALLHKPSAEVAAAAHFALGAVAVASRDYAAADAEYALTARFAPKNVGAHYNRAIALSSLKKYRPALTELESVYKLAPHMVQAHLLAANICIQAKDPVAAVAAFNAVLAIEPRNRIALFSRAITLQRMGRVDDAIAAYKAQLEIDPQEPEAHLNLGLLYGSNHNLPMAREQFLQGSQILDKLGRHDARSYMLLGQSEAQLAENTGVQDRRDAWIKLAADHLNRAALINPTDMAPLYAIADLYRHTGHYTEAIGIYQKRHIAAPDDKKAIYGLADVYIMQTRQADAVNIWRDYQKRQPADPEGYQQIARFLELQGKWADAAAENGKLAARDALDGNAVLAQANELMQANLPVQAEGLYRKLFGYDVTASDRAEAERTVVRANRRAWRLAAWTGLAKIEEGRNNYKGAIDDLQSVKADELAEARKNRVQPDHQVYIEIAQLYERDKHPELAIKELTTLTEVASDDPVGFAELGRLYERQGNTDAAVAALAKASQRGKEGLQYGLEAAELYGKHGQVAKAVEVYAKLRSAYPKETRVLAPLAQALDRAGRYDDALAVYSDLRLADPTLAWVEDRQASVLTIMKRYEQARALREREVVRNPGSVQAYADLAHIYELQGKPADYLAWLLPRVERSPEDPTLLEALLAEYTSEKRAEAGWTALKDVANRNANSVKALKAWATVLQRNGRTADYVIAARRIAALEPNDIGALTDLADALMANGQKADALQVFNAQIARKDLTVTQRQEFRRRLAQRLEAQGDSAAAIPIYKAILVENALDFGALTAFVNALTNAGRFDEIIMTCGDLCKRPEVSPVLRARLLSYSGAAYEKQNKSAAALAQYRDALKANPDDPAAKEAVKRLGGS